MVWPETNKCCLNSLIQDHLKEVQDKWNDVRLDDEIWAKLIYFERNRRLAKAYVSAQVLTIDASRNGLDGYRVGLCGFENQHRSLDSLNCLRSLGQGIKLRIDQQGNILIRKVGSSSSSSNHRFLNDTTTASGLAPNECSVWVGDWPSSLQTTQTTGGGQINDEHPSWSPWSQRSSSSSLPLGANCNMREIEKSDETCTLFDMKKFSKQLDQGKLNNEEFIDWRQCVSVISFTKPGGGGGIRSPTNTTHKTNNLLDDPCWLMIINVLALDRIMKNSSRRHNNNNNNNIHCDSHGHTQQELTSINFPLHSPPNYQREKKMIQSNVALKSTTPTKVRLANSQNSINQLDNDMTTTRASSSNHLFVSSVLKNSTTNRDSLTSDTINSNNNSLNKQQQLMQQQPTKPVCGTRIKKLRSTNNRLLLLNNKHKLGSIDHYKSAQQLSATSENDPIYTTFTSKQQHIAKGYLNDNDLSTTTSDYHSQASRGSSRYWRLLNNNSQEQQQQQQQQQQQRFDSSLSSSTTTTTTTTDPYLLNGDRSRYFHQQRQSAAAAAAALYRPLMGRAPISRRNLVNNNISLRNNQTSSQQGEGERIKSSKLLPTTTTKNSRYNLSISEYNLSSPAGSSNSSNGSGSGSSSSSSSRTRENPRGLDFSAIKSSIKMNFDYPVDYYYTDNHQQEISGELGGNDENIEDDEEEEQENIKTQTNNCALSNYILCPHSALSSTGKKKDSFGYNDDGNLDNDIGRRRRSQVCCDCTKENQNAICSKATKSGEELSASSSVNTIDDHDHDHDHEQKLINSTPKGCDKERQQKVSRSSIGSHTSSSSSGCVENDDYFISHSSSSMSSSSTTASGDANCLEPNTANCKALFSSQPGSSSSGIVCSNGNTSDEYDQTTTRMETGGGGGGGISEFCSSHSSFSPTRLANCSKQPRGKATTGGVQTIKNQQHKSMKKTETAKSSRQQQQTSLCMSKSSSSKRCQIKTNPPHHTSKSKSKGGTYYCNHSNCTLLADNNIEHHHQQLTNENCDCMLQQPPPTETFSPRLFNSTQDDDDDECHCCCDCFQVEEKKQISSDCSGCEGEGEGEGEGEVDYSYMTRPDQHQFRYQSHGVLATTTNKQQLGTKKKVFLGGNRIRRNTQSSTSTVVEASTSETSRTHHDHEDENENDNENHVQQSDLVTNKSKTAPPSSKPQISWLERRKYSNMLPKFRFHSTSNSHQLNSPTKQHIATTTTTTTTTKSDPPQTSVDSGNEINTQRKRNLLGSLQADKFRLTSSNQNLS